jgi:hypothetical protein
MSDFSTAFKNKFRGGVTYKSSLGYDSSTFYKSSSWSYLKDYGGYYDSHSYRKGMDEESKTILRTSYKTIYDTIVILDFPFQIKLAFTRELGSRRSSKYVYMFLPTAVLNLKKTTEEKLDCMCSIGVHESAHLKYTELRTLRKYFELRKICDKKLSVSSYLSEIFVNILEDERVENRLLMERPGYSVYIDKLNKFDYEQSEFLSETQKDKCLQLIKDVVNIIRFRSQTPGSTLLSEEQTNKILDIVEPIYSDSSNTKLSCTTSDLIVEFVMNELYSMYDVSDYEKRDDYLNSELCGILKAIEFDFFRDVYTGKDASLNKGDYVYRTSPIADDLVREEEELVNFCDILNGDVVEYPDDSYVKKAGIIFESDKSNYFEIRKKILPYVPALKKLVFVKDKNFDFDIRGCRSGLLDTTKLAEAYQGEQHVYVRQGQVRTNSTAICIVVDESASMSYGGRIRSARETAVLMYEAFSNIPGVELFIYGHTADTLKRCSTEVTCYCSPKDKNPFSLSKIKAREENRDGQAILTIAKDIRKYTKSHCTMFVLSDGEPCANDYWGKEANNDTKRKIEKAEKNFDMEIFGILIEGYGEAESIYGANKFIDLSKDLSEFAVKLGKIVTNAALKNKTTKITYA